MIRTWWRGRRSALIGLAVAAAAVLAVYAWLDLIPVAQAQPAAPTILDREAEFNGHALEVRDTAWHEFDAPDGSRTLSVTVTARPGDEPDWCGPLLLSEVDGDRVFANVRDVIGAEWDAGESFCDESASAPYRLFAVFLVPEDASGPFWLDIQGDYSETARLPLDL